MNGLPARAPPESSSFRRYEWTFDESRRSRAGDENPAGPSGLVGCRKLKCHTFGVTTLLEAARPRRDANLFITGSIDGWLHVWAEFPEHIDEDRRELEPLARLAAQAAGAEVLLASEEHDLLFSAARPGVKGDFDTCVVLVWSLGTMAAPGVAETGVSLKATKMLRGFRAPRGTQTCRGAFPWERGACS